MVKDTKTLVVIAALNEEKGIGPTLKEIKQHLNNHECLVVDGQSTDKTAEIAKTNGASIIFQEGKGKGNAITLGIKNSRRPDINYIAFVDADFTYPAKYLPTMIKILDENEEVGMVCGNRFSTNIAIKTMPNHFFLGNKLLSITHNLLNGVQLQDPLTGLRILRRELTENWTPKSEGFDIEVELNNLVAKKGMKIIEIPITYRERMGKKKLKITDGFAIFKRILFDSIQIK
jgi:glycosyltransferase involved in cell wall biosynthesis